MRIVSDERSRYREAIQLLYQACPFSFNSYAELCFFATSIPVQSMESIRSVYIFWEVHHEMPSTGLHHDLGLDSILMHMDGLREIKFHLHSCYPFLDCRHAEAWTVTQLYNRTRKMTIEVVVPIDWRQGCEHRHPDYYPILDGLEGSRRIQQLRAEFAWLEIPPETIKTLAKASAMANTSWLP